MKYIVEVDCISRDDWELYAKEFADYTIYQTWPYQQVRSEMDKQELSRVVIKNDSGQVVLMCQVRIKRIKPLGLTIGYVQWGPLFRPQKGPIAVEPDVLKLLRDTYLRKKVNVLRLVPNVLDNPEGQMFFEQLQAGGFTFVPSCLPYRTIYFPVDEGEEGMKKRFHRSWRREIKKAEQNSIEIREGSSGEYFDILEQIYTDAKKRKGFTGLEPEVFFQVQKMLSPREKIHIILAYFKGAPVTAHASSFLGTVAEGILAGSTEAGLACGSSYLVWWRTFLAAHKAGMKIYNLGGIDPERNPKVFQFKKRSGGQECSFSGTFEATTGPVVRRLWHTTEQIYRLFTKH